MTTDDTPHQSPPPALPTEVRLKPPPLGYIARATFVVLTVAWLCWLASHLFVVGILVAGGVMFSVMLYPVVRWLEDRGVPRALALAGIMVSLLSTLGVALYFFVPLALQQVTQLMSRLPGYLQQFSKLLAQLRGRFKPLNGAIEEGQVSGVVGDSLGGIFQTTLDLTGAIMTGAAGLVVMLFLAVFLLLDRSAIKEGLLSFLPPVYQMEAKHFMRRLGEGLGHYLRGIATLMVVIGTVTGVGLYFLGLPNAIAIGIVAGLLEAVPYVGPLIATAIAGVAGFSVSPTLGFAAIAFFFVVQQLEGNILTPFILGGSLKMSPFWITLSLLVGSALGGLPGALLGLPVAIAIQIAIEDYVRTWPSRGGAVRNPGAVTLVPMPDPVVPDVVVTAEVTDADAEVTGPAPPATPPTDTTPG